MGQNLDLIREFDGWLDVDLLDEDLIRIIHTPTMTVSSRMEIMTNWLRSAFLAGARTMAQDSLDTLRDYGTAVAGCETPVRNPTQCFDNAADNLMVYYTQVLDEAEK